MTRASRLRERLYPDAAREDRFQLAPAIEPSEGHLREVQRESTKRRAAWQRSWSLILRAAPPADAAAARACGVDLARFHNPKTGLDLLVPRLCHNYYCPTCPHAMHWTRTTYHARKLASLDPTTSEPLPRVINLVFTLPRELHAWTREDPRVLLAWRRAILRTIGEAYGYKGRKGCPVDRAAFQELGAIMNLHAIGDEAQPWPKWAPHYDIIIPAWKRAGDKIEPLRTTWPERFDATRKKYRANLQRELLPLARLPTPRAELIAFLRTDFETVWHVSRPPKTPTNPDRKGIVHAESAMHRIRYSCRPLFTLQNARLAPATPDTLVYRIEHGRRSKPIVHRVPLRPAMSQLESIRQWMVGRKARTQVGILSKRTYDAAARLAGHEPVRERVSRGLVHKATYEVGLDGRYTKMTRALTGNPAQADDGEAEPS